MLIHIVEGLSMLIHIVEGPHWRRVVELHLVWHHLDQHARTINQFTICKQEGGTQRVCDWRCVVEQHLVCRSGFWHADLCSGSEAGSYLRRIDVCITQL